MAKNILFNVEEGSACKVVHHPMLLKNCTPSEIINRYQKDSPKTKREIVEKLYEQPLINWMFQFVEEVEGMRRGIFSEDASQFTWSFAYYSYPKCFPCWFVVIRDQDNQIVHKNWTITIDYDGDVMIKRGIAIETDGMMSGEYYMMTEAKKRIKDAIYNHLRFRSFALKN